MAFKYLHIVTLCCNNAAKKRHVVTRNEQDHGVLIFSYCVVIMSQSNGMLFPHDEQGHVVQIFSYCVVIMPQMKRRALYTQ
jgi:hypothetical protein